MTFAGVLGTPADRWILAFVLAVLVVLPVAADARRRARAAAHDDVRGVRRRAGVVLAAGPLIGFLVDPGAGSHVAVAAVGALLLAGFGLVVERRHDVDRLVAAVVALAAVGAVVSGVRFGPTGVGVLDVGFAFVVVFAVTYGFDGLGNSDALVPALGAAGAFGLVALGVFGEASGLANGAAGVLGASIAFVSFALPPASLFPGRAGRLPTGFALGVLVCGVPTVPGPPGPLLVAMLLVAVPLLDLVVTAFDRARRRRPLVRDRHDHLVHRLVAYRASTAEAVLVLVLVGSGLVVLAVLVGRGLLPVALGAVVAVFALGALAGYALRAPTERIEAPGLSTRAKVILGVLVGILVLGVVPLTLDLPDLADTMQQGRVAAQRGLAAARRGDAATAEIEFRRASGYFATARDRLGSTRYQAARVVPGLASNLRASKALADIGYELATNGEAVTAAVVPESLAVVDGRVPLEEVERIRPALDQGADTLSAALARLQRVGAEPYLLGSVRTAVVDVRRQLRRGAREARNTALAARLASEILGRDGERRYLLVVQNPAENRGTGGLIGSYAILTVDDGEVSVGPISRTGEWNAAAEAAAVSTYDAPLDYRRRYGQFLPATNLQSVNLSPDFPTVARVLASLAPHTGVGEIDGVIAVDPMGLAALLRLTGPVLVAGWPVDISADNVVDVTLSDAYAAFATTPERADFLGDVAAAVVDAATTGRLGDPATVASELGAAARDGHFALWFTRPREQRLAAAVGADGALGRAGDVLHVTEANIAGNKLDYYLERTLDYRVEIRPDASGRVAAAKGDVVVRLENDAPTSGLPTIVAGPYEGAAPGTFREGEAVSYVSVYTPLEAKTATLDGEDVLVSSGEELGLNVYSTVVRTLAQDGHTLALGLKGRLRMTPKGWYALRLGSQPMVRPGRARISIVVPEGFRITAARGLQHVEPTRASGLLETDGPKTVRLRIERARSGLWSRLDRDL